MSRYSGLTLLTFHSHPFILRWTSSNQTFAWYSAMLTLTVSLHNRMAQFRPALRLLANPAVGVIGCHGRHPCW